MKQKAQKRWTAEKFLELGRSYHEAAVFVAAAELGVFSALAAGPLDGRALAGRLECDERGLVVLLDALAALELIKKAGDRYSLPKGVEAFLTPGGRNSIVAMAQHQANCLRNWAQLAKVVKTGKPAEKVPSVRGAEGDAESFIGAMHNVSAPMADKVIAALKPKFKELLDLGGGSGTWTIAFLRACRGGTATIFDLPHVVAMAEKRMAEASLAERVRLVPGDFMRDPLPGGADLAWVSAIVHQNSRVENRHLFRKVFEALKPGGRIAIRDILMEETRTAPVHGALFAINMLVATPGGGTFTFKELREDLEAAGFRKPSVVRQDAGMNSIVVASKG